MVAPGVILEELTPEQATTGQERLANLERTHQEDEDRRAKDDATEIIRQFW